MPEEIHIPGFAEALASERKDRAVAFFQTADALGEFTVAPLTPYRLEILRASQNPFVTGGQIAESDILLFLWIVSPAFSFEIANRDKFMESHLQFPPTETVNEIEQYIDRMFLDEPHGAVAMPYYSMAAGLIYEMACVPFGWSDEKTLHTPLPVIFQLMKARDKHAGAVVVNKRSYKVQGDFTRDMKIVMEPTRAKLAKAVAKWRKAGWKVMSNENQRQDGQWELAMTNGGKRA